jgi:uncharacterized protein (DUF362 family)
MMNDDDQSNPPSGTTRRAFLAAASAAVALGAVTSCGSDDAGTKKLQATPEQAANKYTGPSRVALINCDSYKEDVFQHIKPFLEKLQLPDLKNKTCVLKINMVEFREGKPIFTNPVVLRGAIELVKHLGAREIIVGEGPGHMRDTQFLLKATGVGDLLKGLGIRFIDLNLDELEKVELKHSFSGLDHFMLPRTVVKADALVSVPKLKTHHWVGITCSMKNLFGIVPGRHYGWPKNVLHWRGIDECILDLNTAKRPTFAVVDGIVAMEGDGPLNGVAKDLRLIAVGNDVAAVDATCARIMELPDISKIKYLRVAGEAIGNVAEDKIELIGTPLNTVAQKFELPACLLPGGLASIKVGEQDS